MMVRRGRGDAGWLNGIRRISPLEWWFAGFLPQQRRVTPELIEITSAESCGSQRERREKRRGRIVSMDGESGGWRDMIRNQREKEEERGPLVSVGLVA
jgi:hypothetical protein